MVFSHLYSPIAEFLHFWNDFSNAEIEFTDIRNRLKFLLKEHLIDKLKLIPELLMNTITSIQLQYPAHTVPFHSSHTGVPVSLTTPL